MGMAEVRQAMFSGNKILIMGLGQNGGGLLSAQFCLAQGAEVLVTDLNAADKLQSSIESLEDFARRHGVEGRLSFRLGGHEYEDFRRADWVIKNPGVPLTSPCLRKARSWTTDLALFLELYPQVPVLAVTGTKGKSSISYALHYILRQYFPAAMLAGNIGRSPLAYALASSLANGGGQSPIDLNGDSPIDLSGHSPLVLELSSWQLGDLRAVEQSRGRVFLRPQMACLSNILRDHQNRYARFWDYVMDKFYIFANLAGDGELFLPAASSKMYLGASFWGDFAVRESKIRDSGHLHYMAAGSNLPKGFRGIYWLGDRCFIREAAEGSSRARPFLRRQDCLLLGQHSFQNYGVACYMAYRFLRRRGLCSLQSFDRRSGELLRRFRGVPFRMELCGRLSLAANRELQFVNDTTATMPDAAAAGLASCLEAWGSFCLLLAGGTDKNLELGGLLAALGRYQGRYALFLLAGSGTDSLLPLLQRAGVPYAAGPSGRGFESLKAAFAAAFSTARAQAAEFARQYILLSPGYASFGMFQNEFERGEQFNALVKQLVNSE